MFSFSRVYSAGLGFNHGQFDRPATPPPIQIQCSDSISLRFNFCFVRFDRQLLCSGVTFRCISMFPIIDNSRFVSFFVYFIRDLKVTFSN